jgi:molybdopterin molybdotransferase
MSRIAEIAASLAGSTAGSIAGSTAGSVAGSLPVYDPSSLSVEGAQAFIALLAASTAVTGTERMALRDALGRVLSEDIVSPVSVPPHDNSAMDGFAFDGALLPDDTAADASLRLRVVGTALAGAAWHGRLAATDAVRIMTGAVMPAGLDTVVPQEFCRIEDDRISFPAKVLRRGDNRRFAGEDLMQGRAALKRGERLSPAALGMVASLGLPMVPVVRRLRVACFSTGDEILSLGDAPREGAVYDSNRYTLFGLLSRIGCEVIDLGLVRDDPAVLADTLQRAAREADAIITSGGVSMGAADHTRAVMERHGDVAFWSVAMRPGRPLAVGLIPRQHDEAAATPALLFGLPGNPVAAMVTFLILVRPALLQMMGCNAAASAPLPLLRARSVGPIRKKPGRTEYQRGFVQAKAGGLPEVRIAGNQGSGILSSMVEANGLVVLHHDQCSVAAGDEVDVMMFDGLI